MSTKSSSEPVVTAKGKRSIGIRVEPYVYERLQEKASREQRSVAQIVLFAVIESLREDNKKKREDKGAEGFA